MKTRFWAIVRWVLIIAIAGVVIACLWVSQAGAKQVFILEDKEWESVEQFRQFYDGLLLQGEGCIEKAVYAQRLAMSRDYKVSVAFARQGYYYGVKVGGPTVAGQYFGHAGLLVEIDNIWYFVDPDGWQIFRLFEVKK